MQLKDFMPFLCNLTVVQIALIQSRRGPATFFYPNINQQSPIQQSASIQPHMVKGDATGLDSKETLRKFINCDSHPRSRTDPKFHSNPSNTFRLTIGLVRYGPTRGSVSIARPVIAKSRQPFGWILSVVHICDFIRPRLDTLTVSLYPTDLS